MKNTRKSNLKARLAAAAMALITMTSTTSLIVNSSLSQTSITVCAASDNMMNLDENIVGAGKVTFEVLMKVLEECTPYGKFAVPAINGIIGMVAGEEPDPVMEKLNEISDKIDRLFDKITESEKTVIGAMETALGSNNAYQSYVNFKNKVTYIKDTIKETVNDDEMSNVNKMAKIGSLIGNFYEWNNTFFDTFNNVNTYFKKSSAYGKNIFETIYDHNCLSSMFSGEAIDKSKEAFRTIIQTYTAGCTVILESLSAQLYVNYLSAETKASVDSEYMAHICQKPKDIMNKIDRLTTALVGNKTEYGFEGKGEIAKMMDETLSKPRNILVNEGHGTPYANLKTDLFSKKFSSIPNVNSEKKNSEVRAEQQAKWFNDNITNGQISGSVVKSVAKYASKQGKTIRTLLNENGFDTSSVPANSYIITDGAWGDSSFKLVKEEGWAYFKGINIDDKSGSEKNVKFWSVGWTGQELPIVGFVGSKWNNAESGSACRFQTI